MHVESKTHMPPVLDPWEIHIRNNLPWLNMHKKNRGIPRGFPNVSLTWKSDISCRDTIGLPRLAIQRIWNRSKTLDPKPDLKSRHEILKDILDDFP